MVNLNKEANFHSNNNELPLETNYPKISLIARLVPAILLVPVFFSKYRNWVAEAYDNCVGKEIKNDLSPDWWKSFTHIKPIPDEQNPEKQIHDSQLTGQEDTRARLTRLCVSKYKSIVKRLSRKHIVKQKALLSRLNFVPGRSGLTMAGVAVVGSYLAAKRNLKGLHVCETLEAFSQKLNDFIKNEQDGRCAFVVASCESSSDKHLGYYPDYPQHKVTVAVEKKNGQLKIAFLDPLVKKESTIDPKHLNSKEIWDDWGTPHAFTKQEVVFRAIFKAGLPKETELYYSKVPRQGSGYGCWTFALSDAIHFLDNDDFFQKISFEPNEQLLGFSFNLINALPVPFMIGTQISDSLNKFMLERPTEVTIKTSKGTKQLKEYLSKHRVTTQTQVGEKTVVKQQNHFITRKTYKYTRIALTILEKTTSEQFEEILYQTYISSSAKKPKYIKKI